MTPPSLPTPLESGQPHAADGVTGLGPRARLSWAKLSAQGKRERLLSAADSAFVETGLDASMPAIAERAAASIGSLYRQFPSKVDLLEAVVARRFAMIERVAADAAVTDGPAWPELVGMVQSLVARQVTATFFADAWEQVGELEHAKAARDRAHREFQRVIARCVEQGSIRSDATADDLWLIFIAARGASVYDTSTWRRTGSDTWRRTVTLMLDGLRR